MRPSTAPSRRVMAGFSLLEPLIAIAITGAGLLGLAKFQATLMEGANVGRQRAEALHLAQEQLENVRYLPYASIVNGTDSAASQTIRNATYARAWSVAASTSPALKTVTVTVSWADQKGANQAISLAGIVSAHDPAASGVIIGSTFAPGAGLRTPFKRGITIPIPAVDNGDGTSSYVPPGSSGVSLKYDNNSGRVTHTTVSGVTTPIAGDGYGVTGYVSLGDGGDSPPATLASIDVATTTTGGEAWDAGSNSWKSAGTWTCWDDSAAPVFSDHVTYTCLVKSGWSGSTALSGFTLGTTNTTSRVCRYYATSPYANITANTSHQNYIVIKGSRSCPSGAVAHQP